MGTDTYILVQIRSSYADIHRNIGNLPVNMRNGYVTIQRMIWERRGKTMRMKRLDAATPAIPPATCPDETRTPHAGRRCRCRASPRSAQEPERSPRVRHSSECFSLTARIVPCRRAAAQIGDSPRRLFKLGAATSAAAAQRCGGIACGCAKVEFFRWDEQSRRGMDIPDSGRHTAPEGTAFGGSPQASRSRSCRRLAAAERGAESDSWRRAASP